MIQSNLGVPSLLPIEERSMTFPESSNLQAQPDKLPMEEHD